MNKHEAIYKIYSNVKYINNDIPYDKDDNVVPIDDNVINAEVNKYVYITQRQQEYPAVVDQLDYIYHNGIDAWKTDMIEPVKTKYPKGTV
jgi:hypothetical protein